MKNIQLRQQIVTEYLNKKISITQLSSIYNTSKPTVSRILRDAGVKIHYFKNLTTSQEEEIIKLYTTEHLGLIETGRRFKVSRTVISRVLESYNIPVRNMSDCHIGQHPWNKGKKWSDEVKIKMGLKAQERTGPKNANWRGGIATKRDKRRTWRVVKQWKMFCLKRDNNICLWCKSDKSVQVHHIIPIRQIKDLDLLVDSNNGITLCKKCHLKTHYHEAKFVDIFRNLLKNHVNSGNTQNGQS